VTIVKHDVEHNTSSIVEESLELLNKPLAPFEAEPKKVIEEVVVKEPQKAVTSSDESSEEGSINEAEEQSDNESDDEVPEVATIVEEKSEIPTPVKTQRKALVNVDVGSLRDFIAQEDQWLEDRMR